MSKSLLLLMRTIIFILLQLVACNAILTGQSYPSRIADDFYSDIKSFGMDYYRTGVYFGQNSEEVLLIIGAGATVTYLSSLVDEPIRDKLSANEPVWNNTVKFLNELGNVKTMGAISGVVYGIGLLTEEKKVRETGRLLVESLIWSGSFNMLLRHSFGRYRPYNGRGNGMFSLWRTDNDYQSFPSGHTTVAFSMATVLAHQFDTWWSYPLFYSLAAGTGATRMYLDQHWLSDVVFGAALGYAGAKLIIHANENKKTPKDFSFSVLPFGVNFTYYIY